MRSTTTSFPVRRTRRGQLVRLFLHSSTCVIGPHSVECTLILFHVLHTYLIFCAAPHRAGARRRNCSYWGYSSAYCCCCRRRPLLHGTMFSAGSGGGQSQPSSHDRLRMMEAEVRLVSAVNNSYVSVSGPESPVCCCRGACT